jgi:hypothetical protein
MAGLINRDGSDFEMRDLLGSREFMQRTPSERPADREQAGLSRLAEKFATSPEVLLQELVEFAVDSCGADASGVSLEEPDGKGGLQFRWIVVAGSFAKYLNGTTPRNYSPCGSCLDQGNLSFIE